MDTAAAVDTVAASGAEDMEAATSTVMEAISAMMTDISTIGRMTTTVGIATGGVGTATADNANIQAGHLSRLTAINARKPIGI